MIARQPTSALHFLFLAFLLLAATATSAFQVPFAARSSSQVLSAVSVGSEGSEDAPITKAPVLDGKRVLPFKILSGGLKGHSVAGVYAFLNSGYKRGYAGWEHCEWIESSDDLGRSLSQLPTELTSSSHIRAISFVIPTEEAMGTVVKEWSELIEQATGQTPPTSYEEYASKRKGEAPEESASSESDSKSPEKDEVAAAIESAIPYEDDYEDDDEDEDDWEFMEMTAEAMSRVRQPALIGVDENFEIESPFQPQKEQEQQLPSKPKVTTTGDLPFTRENVDRVLDEIRPYLISDGGNVSVQRVDEEKQDVYLVLEGACGSCPSSTVTMAMGIERVLKENFSSLGQVVQVESNSNADPDGDPLEVAYQAVAKEIGRIKPAIMAMGGAVDIISVDPTGQVEIKFRGANKVRQGLELALLDVDFVETVKFVED